MEAMKTDLQSVFQELEENFTKIQSIIEKMKQNQKDSDVINQLTEEVNPLFEFAAQKTRNTVVQLDDIKKTWFEALKQQDYESRLGERIGRKIDKVDALQADVATIIDELSLNIQSYDVQDVNGASSDMTIQKQIVSANGLLEKIENLKDKIDAGELDGRSNLGSILNTDIGIQDIRFNETKEEQKISVRESRGMNSSSSGSRLKDSLFGKKKQVKRTVSTHSGSSNNSVSKGFQMQPQVF